MLHFALGKIFDDLKDYERAIAHFDEGNRLERNRHVFNREDFTAEMNRLTTAFPRSPVASTPVFSASERPLLIVGLPRSGTTLAEQILASHPQVAAGGELNFWLQRSEGLRNGAEPHLGPAAERKIIDDYLGVLAAISPDAARVTDKMPYNFLAIGLVHRLFPEARIVHCRRGHLDTALSIYLNRFARGQEFAYDRGDILHYVRGYLRLMAHWREILPAEQFCEIDYEELVADQRAVTATLLDFCGLPWDEACMNFFRTERPIDTLSAWQARPAALSGLRRTLAALSCPGFGVLATLRFRQAARASRSAGELTPVQIGIKPVLCQKSGMSAPLDDAGRPGPPISGRPSGWSTGDGR